ncbi:hypothetical protein VTH82DRAFT_1657 [Thermothelomyces myriococcoides]
MASPVFYQARPPSPPVPLPCVPGPKLAPFTPTAYADIEFIKFLGCENDKDSVVWKVKINGGGPFALKMFYFRQWKYLCLLADTLERPLTNPQLYVDYFDPFNCECRAYGRLKEENREDLAVHALGYLFLTPQQESDLARRMECRDTPPPTADSPELDGDNFWGRHEQHRGLPVRAIVKELVTDRHPDATQALHMWADLQTLHSLGILVGDAHGGNYLNGKLVDFSRSWTMYHPALDQISARKLRSLMISEMQKLLDYYYEVANYSGGETAIPQDLEDFCTGHFDKYKNHPTAYNWLKGVKNTDEIKMYVTKLFKSTDH